LSQTETGYYVWAYWPSEQKFKATDIIHLKKESLEQWLSKYDKENLIRIILGLLGYPNGAC